MMRVVLKGLKQSFIAAASGILLCWALPFMAFAEEPNRLSNYLLNGVTVSGWQLALGDESNWYQPQKDDIGLSANKRL